MAAAPPPDGAGISPGSKTPSMRLKPHDEVTAMLKDLHLDKAFFLSKLQPGFLEELRPLLPENANAAQEAAADSRFQRRRFSMEMLSPEALGRRLEKERQKVQQQNSMQEQEQGDKKMDFDVYLTQALLPVLAQSLDSLCRQLNRMEEQGDAQDPQVRARFNPLTFLAQQLHRRHPNYARTPRRQALYKDFNDWSDFEYGRREMLRMRDRVHKVFNGFVLKGTVHKATVSKVVNAVDDTLRLGGVLKRNAHVQDVFGPTGSRHNKQRDAWSFSQFWYQFGNLFLAHDIVPYSAIEHGAQVQAQEREARLAREKEKREKEERRKKEAAERRKSAARYAKLHQKMLADPCIKQMLQEDKILTGDEMRPGDVGYENEVPPRGPHVSLLADYMALLGLKLNCRPNGQRQGSKEARPVSAPEEEKEAKDEDEWWTDDLANAWAVLQTIQGQSLTDGVVEKEALEGLLVPPEGFLLLKARVEEELKRRDHDLENPAEWLMGKSMTDFGAESHTKPSMAALCEQFAMPMDRMTWLHELFERYLLPEEGAPEGAPPRKCGYPDNPASLRKLQMKALLSEVNPNLTDAEFEARFRRIDNDKSGEIEFDEFVAWVHNDEIQVMGTIKKMSLAELAQAYGEPISLIQLLHVYFKSHFPEGEVDKYPEEPKGLEKDRLKELLEAVTGELSHDFEADYRLVDVSDRGKLDFDEFLEMLDFGDIVDEIRDRCQ